jgi:ADP-dependent NAD(P)H-hydrate dehydratase / NAD(P)H-hydrate epimerase
VKILSAADIRAWDQYTIQHEPVASIDLMERAAGECVSWILKHYPAAPSFAVFCGKGNNGGDGLAIARMLLGRGYPVFIYILEFGHKGTDDFQTNLARLHQIPTSSIHFIQSENNFHAVPYGQVIIDSLFGSGLNRALEDVTAKLVEHINHSGEDIISIDIPSGLFTDRSSKGNMIVRAKHTLSFQCYKPAFLAAENAAYIGEVHILDIGLHLSYLDSISNPYELTDESIIRSIYRPRNRFSHKGNFGHALMVAGSYGKIGAAILSSRACLRSGAGLLTCHVPKCGYDVMQTSLPEAMTMTDFNSSFLTKIEEDLTKYDAIGIGPGIGTASETRMLVREIFDAYRSPMVLDADALNCISLQKVFLQLIPAGSILTPHPKEFERLFGKTNNDFERQELAMQKAKELNVIIVLKGHHTLIATTDGKAFFNSTGNAGMATAGSGDVLTGILTGLLVQGYSSIETAILGVYLHGKAGDIAADHQSPEAMIAGDIIENIGAAFKNISALSDSF